MYSSRKSFKILPVFLRKEPVLVQCAMAKSSCNKVDSPCGARTINLAKDNLSAEERRTRMLVYEKKYPAPPFCGAQLPVGVKSTPKSAKKIRVCTALDMKNTCPPVMCTCPPLKPPLTLWGMIKRGISLGIRAAVVGAVVWWTYDIGIWGNAIRTERLYVSAKNRLLLRDPDVDEKEGAPKLDRNMHTGGERWNLLVTKSFQCMTAFANKLIDVLTPKKPDCPACEPEDTQTKKK